MKNLYRLDGLLFKADNLEDLKNKIANFYSLHGLKPHVEIIDGAVSVEVNTVKHQKAEELFNEGSNLVNKGKLEDALEKYFEVVRIVPYHTDSLRAISQIQMLQGDLECALDSCIEALRWNPENLYSLILMGNIFNKKGDRETAQKYYERVLEIDPINIFAQNNLCGILIEDGNYNKAIKILGLLINVDDVPLNTYYALALAYYRRNEGGDQQIAFDVILKGLLTAQDRVENSNTLSETINLMKAIAEKISSSDFYYVIETAIDIIHMLDGSKVELTPDPNFQAGAHLVSRHNSYVVVYNPNWPYVQHDIMRLLLNLKFILQSKAADTSKVAKIAPKQYSNFRQRFGVALGHIFKNLDRDSLASKIDAVCDNLIQGLVRDCLNLFVEDAIYNDYRILRPLQMLALFKQELDGINLYQQAAKAQLIPLPLLSIQQTIGILKALVLKKMFAVDMANQYRPNKKEFELAQDLYKEFLAYKNCKPGEEFEFVEYVIDSLGLQEYVTIESISAANSDSIDEDEYKLLNDILKHEGYKLTAEQEESVRNFNEENKGDDPMVNMMMAMYMLGAMQYFQTWSTSEVRRTAMEIAMLGTKGISPSIKSGYHVASMPDKDMGGYQMLAYYYVSWSIAEPQALHRLGLGMFDNAYEMAQMMYNKRKGNE